MKKVLMMMAACAVIAACQQKGKTAADQNGNDTAMVSDSMATDSLKYSGTIPAADGPGIKYTVALASDSTNGFSMEEVYIQAENGKDAVKNYSGKAELINKTVKGKDVKAYKLPMDKINALYLLVKDDSTLRVVNEALEEAASKNNYDLKLVK